MSFHLGVLCLSVWSTTPHIWTLSPPHVNCRSVAAFPTFNSGGNLGCLPSDDMAPAMSKAARCSSVGGPGWGKSWQEGRFLREGWPRQSGNCPSSSFEVCNDSRCLRGGGRSQQLWTGHQTPQLERSTHITQVPFAADRGRLPLQSLR